MLDPNGSASGEMRAQAGADTRNGYLHHTGRLRSPVPGDRWRALRGTQPWLAGDLSASGREDTQAGALSGRGQRSPGARGANGGPVGSGGSGGSDLGFQFDRDVPSGGYAWWYIDAVSDDGRDAIVLIAFVGSVFSPYYAWKKWREPEDHCALNVAVYGSKRRWAMTERRRGDVARSASAFEIGRSAVRQIGDKLEVDINERTAPFAGTVRGRVTVTLPRRNDRTFALDAGKEHFWRPICPSAKVDVSLSSPALSWSGRGYVDTNYGGGPLERAFEYWDWSRTPLRDGGARIRYVADGVDGQRTSLALAFDPGGAVSEMQADADDDLPATSIWRIPRRTGSGLSGTPRIVQTLEDTPFYSRSLLESRSEDEGLTVHESLSGARLRNGIVKAMLPFRMPRRSL